MNEKQTREKLVNTKLSSSGWDSSSIREEVILCPGKLLDDIGTRKRVKKADYLLSYEGMLLAVVEAKDENHIPEDGIQQSKAYAKMLDAPFAYSTNGHGIEEFDFLTNKQKSITAFPKPAELWRRFIASRSEEAGSKQDVLKMQSYMGDKVPRYYQGVAVKRCIEAVIGGKKKVLITMATGTGKTFTAFQIIWKLYNSGFI